jgi:Kdo2-lipid IVA lauroyltransferase/acyltransferase
MPRQLSPFLIYDYLLYLLVRFVDVALCAAPESWSLAFGRLVGRMVFATLKDRRDAALENLTIAFGNEKSRDWILKTARGNFEHLGMSAVEFFRLRRWTHAEMMERIELEGTESYNLVMSPGNHGVCILNSHFGSFEVGAALAKLLGWNVHLIITELRNPFLSKYLFSRGGEGTGITTHPHKGSVKALIEVLRNNGMVAFLGDQRGDAERGVFVDFFGTPAPANEVFAKIAIEGRAMILPLATYRLEGGRYKAMFGEPVSIEVTGDARADLTTVSALFHQRFEQWLRMKPEQGYWVQRKWRRKPSKRRKKP